MKTFLKITGFVVVGILLLILIVSLAAGPLARNYLEDQINQAGKGQYTATIDRVRISLLGGNFSIHGLRLHTDTLLARQDEAPVISLEAGELSAEGVSWLDFLMTDTLQMRRVSLQDIDIKALVRLTDTVEESPPFRWEDLDIYPMINDYVDRLRLNDLQLRDISLSMVNVETRDTLLFNARQFYMHSDNILVDANTAFSSLRTFYATGIDVQGLEVEVSRYGQQQFHANFHEIEFQTRENLFGMRLINATFLQQTQENLDTMLFGHAPRFVLTDLDMNQLTQDSIAHISLIMINDLRVWNNLELDLQEVEEEIEEADKKSPGIDLSQFTMGDELPEMAGQLIIDNISIRNMNYRQMDDLKAHGIDFQLKELRIDQDPAFSDERFLHAMELGITIDSISVSEKKQDMELRLARLDFSMRQGSGSFIAENIELRQDPGEMLAGISASRLGITGIDTRQITSKILGIDSIALDQASMVLNLENGPDQEVDEPEEIPIDLYPVISGQLQRLNIRKIALVEADLQVGLPDFEDPIHLPRVYVQLTDMDITENTAFEGQRVLHAADVALRLENTALKLPDNEYEVQLDLLSLSTSRKNIDLEGFSYSYATDYVDILESPEVNQVYRVKGQQLRIRNLEFEPLVRQEGFFASEISLEGLDVEIYQDHHFPPEETEDTLPATPQQMIRDVELPVYLGQLSVSGGRLVFVEMQEGGEEPGTFILDDFTLEIENLTNVDNIIEPELETVIQFNGFIMGEGYLAVNMVMPMHGEQMPVRIWGYLDTLDLTTLNEYTEYTSMFGFESGVIYTMHWDFEAGDELADGSFGLSYEDLSIRLTEDPGPEPAGTIYQIIEYLANALVLDESMAERPAEPMEIAEFERQMDEEESFVEHYIMSLMAGFIELMGFPLSLIDP